MILGPAIQKLLALALLALVVLVAWTAGIAPLAEKYRGYQATAAQSQELIARYKKILAGAAVLQADIEAIGRNRILKQGLIAAPSANLGAAQLQAQIKRTSASGEAKLISVQVLPAKQQAGFAKVGVRARLKGNTAALHTTLHELETAWPAVVIDNLNVRARTRRVRRDAEGPRRLRVDSDLTIRFDAFGFMAEPKTGAAAPPQGGGR